MEPVKKSFAKLVQVIASALVRGAMGLRGLGGERVKHKMPSWWSFLCMCVCVCVLFSVMSIHLGLLEFGLWINAPKVVLFSVIDIDCLGL